MIIEKTLKTKDKLQTLKEKKLYQLKHELQLKANKPIYNVG